MESRHPARTWWLAVILLIPCSAAAQDWTQPWSDPRDRPPRVDISVSGGGLAPTDWSDAVVLGSVSSVSGALEQVLVRDLRVEPGPIFGVGVTYWRDRYGFRVRGALARSSLTIGGAPLSVDEPSEDLRPTDVDTWLYEVGGAIGLVEYSPGRRAWPYVFFGFGGITYDLDRAISPPLLAFIERAPVSREGSRDVVIVEDDGRQFLLSTDELGLETVFAVNFGIGTDLRLPFGGGALGLRLELSDHLAPSPVRVRIRELGSAGGLTDADTVDFGAVHHLRAAAALVIQFGR